MSIFNRKKILLNFLPGKAQVLISSKVEINLISSYIKNTKRKRGDENSYVRMSIVLVYVLRKAGSPSSGHFHMVAR